MFSRLVERFAVEDARISRLVILGDVRFVLVYESSCDAEYRLEDAPERAGWLFLYYLR